MDYGPEWDWCGMAWYTNAFSPRNRIDHEFLFQHINDKCYYQVKGWYHRLSKFSCPEHTHRGHGDYFHYANGRTVRRETGIFLVFGELPK